MIKKILLTGATGHLGMNVMDRLIREGIPYIATSLHGNSSLNIRALDLTDILKINDFVSKNDFSTIFHIGGFVNLSRDYETACKCIEDNLVGTLNLLEACKERDDLKIVFASTEEIYGDNLIPYIETQEPHPPSPYSISKVAAENFINFYSKKFRLKSFIFRIGTMYGPYMPKHRFIYKLIDQAIKNDPILINSGKKKRDYVYVEDVVDAFMLAANRLDVFGINILNIGGGLGIRLDDFAKKIVQYSGSSSVLEYNSAEERIDEAPEWKMDIARSKELLGWSPRTTIDEGLKRTISFYKNHESF